MSSISVGFLVSLESVADMDFQNDSVRQIMK